MLPVIAVAESDPQSCRHRSPAPVAAFPTKLARNLYSCDCHAATPAGLTTLRHCADCEFRNATDCVSRAALRTADQAAADQLRILGIPPCTGC